MDPRILQRAAIHKDERTHAIIGAAMDVHRQLGHGFLEAIYQEALAVELAARAIPFQKEPELVVHYKGQPLRSRYRADFVCYGAIVVELKALGSLSGTEQAQVLHYLKATGMPIGLLINFGRPTLDYHRFIYSGGNLRKSAKSAN